MLMILTNCLTNKYVKIQYKKWCETRQIWSCDPMLWWIWRHDLTATARLFW